MRRKPKPVVSNYTNILEKILQLNKTVLLEVDIFFVNWMVLLVSIYRHVKFTTVKYLVKERQGIYLNI